MKLKIQKSIKKVIFLLFIILFSSSCDQKSDNDNKVYKNTEINVKVFSSLTCPHCANFHKKVILKVKSDKKLSSVVKIEHVGFPLDLAALNAEKILYCFKNEEKRLKLLTHLYDEQDNWASGSDINDINESLKKISKKFETNNIKVENCLKDEKIEDEVLEISLNAQKKFKIKSTPTIFINDKMYRGKHDFQEFKKALEELL